MPSSLAICRRNCQRTYIRHPTRANSVGGVTPLGDVRPEPPSTGIFTQSGKSKLYVLSIYNILDEAASFPLSCMLGVSRDENPYNHTCPRAKWSSGNWRIVFSRKSTGCSSGLKKPWRCWGEVNNLLPCNLHARLNYKHVISNWTTQDVAPPYFLNLEFNGSGRRLRK